jgi:multidrug transporter EmrE-like cation transporter
MMGYLYISLTVILTTAGQLLTKKGVENSAGSIVTLFNRYIASAAVMIMITPVFYVLALRKLDLSVAFAFTGLNYVFVSLGGKVFFREKLNRFHYLGIACIFLGLGIFQL